MQRTEEELEAFRKQWREEVTKRPGSKPPARSGDSSAASSSTAAPKKGKQRAPPTYSRPVQDHDDSDFTPRAFHDLPDKEDYLRLENGAIRHKAFESSQEPETALEHYEKAVEQEAGGRLGDSVTSYRKAFRLDDQVHDQYKKKYFPASSFPKKAQPEPSAPDSADAQTTQQLPPPPDPGPVSMQQLMEDFADMEVTPLPPATDLSEPPPCPIADVPGELMIAVLSKMAHADPALLCRFARVCKRFAYLVMTENSVWREICMDERYGFAAMLYRYTVNLKGNPLWATKRALSDPSSPTKPRMVDMTPAVYPTHRQQFRHRPRIRFNGAYISTSNYIRQGQAGQSKYTWNHPVHIVTYYRYLRFFRDGTVISLLTTAEPTDVVHYLQKDYVHVHLASGLPQVVMKDALLGRWRLTGPASSGSEDSFHPEAHEQPSPGPGEYEREPQSDWSILGNEEEKEGDVLLETEGVVPRYMYKMHFGFANAGKKNGPRNNKLVWKGFWSWNRISDDWSEFGLKHDKPYYFSRVKSYGMGL